MISVREKKKAEEEDRKCQWHTVKMKLKERIILEMSGYQMTVEVREKKWKELILYTCFLAKLCAEDTEYGHGVDLWD